MIDYKEIGLTKSEWLVFESLVRNGKKGAYKLSGVSGVTYSKIYNVLDSLVNKGLVRIVPEKPKKFIAEPEFLLNYLTRKQKDLENLKDIARTMDYFFSSEKNPVILAGKGGFYEILKNTKKIERYSYNIKWSSRYDDSAARANENLIKSGKDIKNLVRYTKETKNNVHKWIKINKNIRKISNEGVALSIVDDSEVVIALIKSDLTIHIKDAPFAKMMRNLFLDSYLKASKIES